MGDAISYEEWVKYYFLLQKSPPLRLFSKSGYMQISNPSNYVQICEGRLDWYRGGECLPDLYKSDFNWVFEHFDICVDYDRMMRQITDFECSFAECASEVNGSPCISMKANFEGKVYQARWHMPSHQLTSEVKDQLKNEFLEGICRGNIK